QGILGFGEITHALEDPSPAVERKNVLVVLLEHLAEAVECRARPELGHVASAQTLPDEREIFGRRILVRGLPRRQVFPELGLHVAQVAGRRSEQDSLKLDRPRDAAIQLLALVQMSAGFVVYARPSRSSSRQEVRFVAVRPDLETLIQMPPGL